jgi:hypothetical protein
MRLDGGLWILSGLPLRNSQTLAVLSFDALTRNRSAASTSIVYTIAA